MGGTYSLFELFGNMVPTIKGVLTVIIALIISSTVMGFIRTVLLKRHGHTKHHISNVKLFTRAINYLILILVIIVVVSYYSGSWESIGIIIGLMSAALGFALQKPITGVAAWIMIIFKRPFEIGDRIVVGDYKGDVKDIGITHIYLDEIGGTVQSEENSGRTVIVPNHYMFDHDIINYTLQNDYVLDEVVTMVTYESNLELTKKIVLKAAKRLTKDFRKVMSMDPYVRTFFEDSGIKVYVRYYVPARRRQETASEITQYIFADIKKIRNVEIAYPHTEIVFKDKKLFKKKR